MLRHRANAGVVAQTAFGRIRGVEVRGIKVFKGVPYGASTAGANRFRPAVDPMPWTGIRDALRYGSTAPQSDPSLLCKPAPRNGADSRTPAASMESC